MQLHPLETDSLKDLFVKTMIEQILTEELAIGERLPSERDISEQMNISRNLVRMGIAELALMGFLTIEPRRGTFVADYMRDGNLGMMDAIFKTKFRPTPPMLYSMLDFRMRSLSEAAGICASRRTQHDLERLHSILDQQATLGSNQNGDFVQLDFGYHKELYIISRNMMHTMIHNSVKLLHHTMAMDFYEALPDKTEVLNCHIQICNAIEQRDAKAASDWVIKVLKLGNEVMRRLSYLPEEPPRDIIQF